jgi:hypothetical protein
MRIVIATLGAVVLIGAGADAQRIKDPPWNPEHIDHLPADVRSAVLAKCPRRPNAGHYFATCITSTCTGTRRHSATTRSV